MTIAERIRFIRQQKNLSQKELSEKANVNLKSLSRYEVGTSVPPADTLKLIADALGVSSDSLLEDNTLNNNNIDKELLQKIEIIQNLEAKEKTIFNAFLDMMIRDHKTKQAYTS
jgi:transcriptional regulator with XRE-family HTH domain